jgi:ParB/RepB/Spo0J family partition protein
MTTATLLNVAIIPLGEIRDVGNVRQELRGIEDLAESIRRHGMLTAVTVEPHPEGGYTLAAGSRRLAAARLAGLDEVPAVIVPPGGDVERLLKRAVENIDREQLTDLEAADAMQQLLDLGADTELVAAALHTTPDNIEAWRVVAGLPTLVRELIEAGTMTARDAHELTAVSESGEELDECLRRIGEGWNVKSAVETVVRERKRRLEEEKTRSRLAKEGCAIVDSPNYGYFAHNSKAQRLGQGHGDVHIAKREHIKQPCHAAFVDKEGKANYVCTDRSRHAGVEGSGVPDLKAERATRRADKKLLREAHATRFRAVGEALRNHAFTRDEAVSHVLTLWVSEAKPAVGEVAAELLGLVVAKDGGIRAAEEALTAHAAGGEGCLVDVALAIALAAGEHGLTTDRFDYSSEAVAAHMRFLEETGIHPLTEIERAAVRTRLPWDLRQAAPAEAEGEEPDDDDGDPAKSDTDGAAA